jgi:hypothetical protein
MRAGGMQTASKQVHQRSSQAWGLWTWNINSEHVWAGQFGSDILELTEGHAHRSTNTACKLNDISLKPNCKKFENASIHCYQNSINVYIYYILNFS